MCYDDAMTEIITATTTLTNTHSVVLVQLSSGNLAMIEYSISVGDVLVSVLLAALVIMQAAKMWMWGKRGD
jgi:hypothetical protein